MVVPDSSRELSTDGDLSLHTVTLFKNSVEQFKASASAHKFIVRSSPLDAEGSVDRQALKEKKAAELRDLWIGLMRLLKTNFGEVFSAWVHLKILRIFVESVLRYGLPPSYLIFILKPLESDKKLRESFLQLLEGLKLPGISQLELLAAINDVGDKKTQARSDAANDPVEAEIWHALHSHNIGAEFAGAAQGCQFFDPYVNLSIKWTC